MVKDGHIINASNLSSSTNSCISQFVDAGDELNFAPKSTLPIHLLHWRHPTHGPHIISPPGHHNTLQLKQSTLNLTAYGGNYAGPSGQTLITRRQTDTLFLQREFGLSTYICRVRSRRNRFFDHGKFF